MAKSTDLRLQLEAIARGEKPAPAPGTRVLDLDFVQGEQQAFGAWRELARSNLDVFDRDSDDGEALTAPAEILAPLP